MPSGVFPVRKHRGSAKCLPLLEPSYLQSQKQPGHFQQPIKVSVLGQQEKQTVQRVMAEIERDSSNLSRKQTKHPLSKRIINIVKEMSAGP